MILNRFFIARVFSDLLVKSNYTDYANLPFKRSVARDFRA
jgi:hypothetical protein